MASKKSLFSPGMLLSVAVGLYLLALGVSALVDYLSDGATLARELGSLVGAQTWRSVIAVSIAVFEVLAGTVLLVSPFGILPSAIRRVASWVVLIGWAVALVWQSFFRAAAFEPSALAWFSGFSLALMVFAALWALKAEPAQR